MHHDTGHVHLIDEKLESLKRSKFRSRFRLTAEDFEYIRSRDMKTIRSHARDFITTRIAPANPAHDGKQTPMRNHPVFIAQHATATCCRGCLEKWHGIRRGKKLDDTEIAFIVDLIMAWIQKQML